VKKRNYWETGIKKRGGKKVREEEVDFREKETKSRRLSFGKVLKTRTSHSRTALNPGKKKGGEAEACEILENDISKREGATGERGERGET